ncbi:MAG: hypothetical protein AAGF12_12770 [Myxococcota bacterium]
MLFALFLALFLAGGLVGCDLTNDGVNPPRGELNFPIAIELSPDAQFLFVANSNFDLRFNAGTVQSFRVNDMVSAMRAGQTGPALQSVEVAPTDVLESEVLLGSHMSGLAVDPEGQRLYLPVRSDANLTFIDLNGGNMVCGGDNSRRCSDRFRAGNLSVASQRDISLPNDPVGLEVRDLSDFAPGAVGVLIMTAHRTGELSLFTDQMPGAGTDSVPTLLHVASDLGDNVTTLSFDDRTATAWLPTATFDNAAAPIGRAALAIDPMGLRSFSFSVGPVRATDVNDGDDIRDVAFRTLPDGSNRAYVLSRSPEGVLVVDLDRSLPGQLFVRNILPIGIGPSRLEIASFLVGRPGEEEERTLLFASCFNTRDVHIIDTDREELVGIIRRLSGPFELVVDPSRNLVFVADFRSSTVRVVDLQPLFDCLTGSDAVSCEPVEIGSLGAPRPVGELL